MFTISLSGALRPAEVPTGKDVSDGLKAVSELPAHYATPGLIGLIVGLAAGAGISSYSVDKRWGDPAALGWIYWAACCVGGVFVALIALS